MIPHGMYTSSESDSDTESESFADQVNKVNSPKQMEHPPKESEEDTSDFYFTDLRYDEYLEKTNKKDASFDYSKAPEPFPVRMIPHGMYTSSESDSDTESESFADQVNKVNSPKQMEHPPKESEEDTSDFDFTDLTYDEYLEKTNKKDASFDYSKAPEPFPVHMIPHGIYTSSDSDSDSDSESEDKSKLNSQSSALSEDDKAPPEPKEESPHLAFPTSSILVKHGMKRPAKAGAGDKDSKRAREMASQTSDGENKGSESRVLL